MYITVLDFEAGRVWQYNINTYDCVNEEYPTTQLIEDFLVGKGHNLKNCEWMTHSDETIIKIKIEL